jgi:hypothetical protein
MCNDSDYEKKHIRHQRCFFGSRVGIIPKDEFTGSSLQRKRTRTQKQKRNQSQ